MTDCEKMMNFSQMRSPRVEVTMVLHITAFAGRVPSAFLVERIYSSRIAPDWLPLSSV